MEKEGEGEEEGGKDSRHLPPPSLLLPLPSSHAGSPLSSVPRPPLPGDSWMLFLHCGWKVGAYCGADAVDVTSSFCLLPVPPATLTPLSITPHFSSMYYVRSFCRLFLLLLYLLLHLIYYVKLSCLFRVPSLTLTPYVLFLKVVSIFTKVHQHDESDWWTKYLFQRDV